MILFNLTQIQRRKKSKILPHLPLGVVKHPLWKGEWRMFRQVGETRIRTELYGDTKGQTLLAQETNQQVCKKVCDLSSAINKWKELPWKSEPMTGSVR
jgi:hypothetical protein